MGKVAAGRWPSRSTNVGIKGEKCLCVSLNFFLNEPHEGLKCAQIQPSQDKVESDQLGRINPEYCG